MDGEGKHNDVEWQWMTNYYYNSWDELEVGTPQEVDGGEFCWSVGFCLWVPTFYSAGCCLIEHSSDSCRTVRASLGSCTQVGSSG